MKCKVFCQVTVVVITTLADLLSKDIITKLSMHLHNKCTCFLSLSHFCSQPTSLFPPKKCTFWLFCIAISSKVRGVAVKTRLLCLVLTGWTALMTTASLCTYRWWRLWCCSLSSVWSIYQMTRTRLRNARRWWEKTKWEHFVQISTQAQSLTANF